MIKNKAKALEKLKKVIKVRDAYKSTSPKRNQANNKLPLIKHGVIAEENQSMMNHISEMDYIDEMGIFHEGNYDDLSDMYRKRKVSFQNIFCLPPSPIKIALSKRNHNYSVEVDNANDIKSRVSFLPAAVTTKNQSLKSRLEMMKKSDRKYSKRDSDVVKIPKGEHFIYHSKIKYDYNTIISKYLVIIILDNFKNY